MAVVTIEHGGDRAGGNQRVGRLVELGIAEVRRLRADQPVALDRLHLRGKIGAGPAGIEPPLRQPRHPA